MMPRANAAGSAAVLSMQDGGAEIGEAGRAHRLSDGIDAVIGERHLIEGWRVVGKEFAQHLVLPALRRVETVRIPHAEEIMSARREDAICLAIGLLLVREKHDAELTDEGVEALVGKWQVGRIGRLELDRLARLELCARPRASAG
jgi:hypothetical protein